MNHLLRIMALYVAVFCLPVVIKADIIVKASGAGSTGKYSYAYQVNNQTDVGLLAFSLLVTGNVGVIQSPTGWVSGTGTPAPGEILVQWFSMDVPFDISASGTLAGCGKTHKTRYRLNVVIVLTACVEAIINRRTCTAIFLRKRESGRIIRCEPFERWPMRL